MSVEKYGKGWRYRFDLGPDPLTGKRRQVTRGGFTTKREATAAMNEAMQASRNGRFVRWSARTVRDFLTEWLSARQLGLKPSTWQSYRDYAQFYVEPILGDTKLSELTAQRLNLLYLHLLENGRCQADRNALMYGYWKSAVASGGDEPTARTLAEVGGVTYDAARKALIRYRAGRIPTPKRDGLAPNLTCLNTGESPQPSAHGAAVSPARPVSHLPTAASKAPASASVSTRQIVVFDGGPAGRTPARMYRSARTVAGTSLTQPVMAV